ncbi:MAG: WG repeat-containing protein [Bacteroidota bacterium]
MKQFICLIFSVFFSSILISSLSAQTNGRIFGPPSEGLRSFLENGKMGFVDLNGKEICPARFDYPELEALPYFREGRCMFFKKNDTLETNDFGNVFFGFINQEFDVMIPAIYPYHGFYCDGFPSAFSNGYAIVTDPSQPDEPPVYFVIDKSGKQIGQQFRYDQSCTAACYYYPEIFDGMTIMQTDSGVTYNELLTGKRVIPNTYSVAGPICGGVAAVEIDGKYITIIDLSGKPVTSKKFHTVQTGSTEKSRYNNEWGGCSYLGGFVKDRMSITYFDNDGSGPQVYALIDKSGNVLIKKYTESTYDDPDFLPYEWNFGR